MASLGIRYTLYPLNFLWLYSVYILDSNIKVRNWGGSSVWNSQWGWPRYERSIDKSPYCKRKRAGWVTSPKFGLDLKISENLFVNCLIKTKVPKKTIDKRVFFMDHLLIE